MKFNDIVTPESITAYDALSEAENAIAVRLMDKYKSEWEEMRKTYPDLEKWKMLLENFQFDQATEPMLLQSLRQSGFIMADERITRQTTTIVAQYKFVSPRYLDADRKDGTLKLTTAYTTLKFCIRTKALPCKPKINTVGMTNPSIIDCEVFEIPFEFTDDMFDDREKIHVVYLAGMKDDRFSLTPIYVGIGTGEAFGTGPQHRQGKGRFRFFRYDAYQNMQCEFIHFEVLSAYPKTNVKSIPGTTKITPSKADLLDGRATGEQSYLCLSDPKMAEGFQDFLTKTPENNIQFRELRLSKKTQTLPCQHPKFPIPSENIDSILTLAKNCYRYFCAAWMHPARLSANDAIALYYRQLPEYRRQQYEVYQVRPEHFGETGLGKSIPEVLTNPTLRDRLSAPIRRCLERWFRRQLVGDLYAYGNHPELRLCLGLILCRLLFRSGIWPEAVRAAYDGKLYSVDFSLDRLLKDPSV